MRATMTVPETTSTSGSESLTVSSGVLSTMTRSQPSMSFCSRRVMRWEASSSEGFGGGGPAGRIRSRPASVPASGSTNARASGISPTSTPPSPAAPGTWKRHATCGRRRSASTRITSLPARAIARARLVATVVLPSPGAGLVMSTLLISRSTLKYVRLARSVWKASSAAPSLCSSSNALRGTALSSGRPVSSSSSEGSRILRSEPCARTTAPKASRSATIAARMTVRATRGATGELAAIAGSTTRALLPWAARSVRRRCSCSESCLRASRAVDVSPMILLSCSSTRPIVALRRPIASLVRLVTTALAKALATSAARAALGARAATAMKSACTSGVAVTLLSRSRADERGSPSSLAAVSATAVVVTSRAADSSVCNCGVGTSAPSRLVSTAKACTCSRALAS